MGKSPGKWIKTVLLGKKNSKTKFADGKEKSAGGKEVHVRVMAPETVIDDIPQEVHSGGLNAVHVDEHNSSSEYQEASIHQEKEIAAGGSQNAYVEQTRDLDTFTDAESIAQEKAATKTQAAFRGYLARRAFNALRGIIRLQALIRGHLVRRQAVATLHCIIGIVKLQALVRGSRIRRSDAGIEVPRVCIVKPLDVTTTIYGDFVSTSSTSLSANAFIRKLLAVSPEGMPLRVQYDETDSNSVQIWLERWSTSCPWKSGSSPKKSTDSKIQKKQGNSQATEGERVRPKRSVRKVPSLFDNTIAQSNSELEKPRRSPKKVSCYPADSIQENPQNELEKVKRSLRKVHNPVTESSAFSEVTESLPQNQVKTMIPSVLEVPDPNAVNPVENTEDETVFILKEEAITAPKENGQETTEDSIETSQSIEISNGEITMVKLESFEGDEKYENTPVPNGELKPMEESVLRENHKSCGRASLPVKQEHVEDGLQNTPKLPSYMQATQSAKAKSRGQGSPRISQESAEKNNLMRRHSLPSPANGKVNSVSPRPLQGSGKGGNKNDRSLLSSRDGNALPGKATQGWRR